MFRAWRFVLLHGDPAGQCFAIHSLASPLGAERQSCAPTIFRHNTFGVTFRPHMYIDDQDECLMDIPPEVTVFKIRNDGNFEESKWLYSSRTGSNIEL